MTGRSLLRKRARVPLVSRTAIYCRDRVGFSPVSFGWTRDKQDLERLEKEIKENRRQREKLDQVVEIWSKGFHTPLQFDPCGPDGTAGICLSRLESKLPELRPQRGAQQALNARRQQMMVRLRHLNDCRESATSVVVRCRAAEDRAQRHASALCIAAFAVSGTGP